MLDDVLSDARQRMAKSLEAFRVDLSKVRTGRAHTGLLEHVVVEYYGNKVPLSQAANINVADARTLAVSPWDKGTIPDIDKAIRNADLGLNPVAGGDTIRVPLPPLTEERRRQLTKVVRAEVEQVRVAVRNVRRDAKQSCKALVKEKLMTEDEERRAEERLQKLTDEFVAQADELLEKKEREMMEL